MRDRALGILIGLLLLSLAAFPQTPTAADSANSSDRSYAYLRHYKPGEIDRYEVRVRDSLRDSELIGVSEHRVFVRNDIPAERVRWLRLTESQIGDLSAMALEVPSYELSLDPKGELKLLDVKGDPIMLELVTDLFTFFFAVSPAAGIGNLQRTGDTFTRPELITNEWANGDEFLAGESRSQLRLGLVSREVRSPDGKTGR